MTDTPVDLQAARAYYLRQSIHLSPPAQYNIEDWYERCQQLAHTAYGLFTGGFASAHLQFLGCDPEDRHLTSNLNEAPLGSFMITGGENPAWHTFFATNPFASGLSAGWSNDIVQNGHVDKCDRNAPRDHWGHENKGWITTINGYALDLTHGGPPKPKQNKRYQRIEKAHGNLGLSLDDLHKTKHNLQGALATAEKQHDSADVTKIKHNLVILSKSIQHVEKEVHRLEGLYSNARHS